MRVNNVSTLRVLAYLTCSSCAVIDGTNSYWVFLAYVRCCEPLLSPHYTIWPRTSHQFYTQLFVAVEVFIDEIPLKECCEIHPFKSMLHSLMYFLQSDLILRHTTRPILVRVAIFEQTQCASNELSIVGELIFHWSLVKDCVIWSGFSCWRKAWCLSWITPPAYRTQPPEPALFRLLRISSFTPKARCVLHSIYVTWFYSLYRNTHPTLAVHPYQLLYYIPRSI